MTVPPTLDLTAAARRAAEDNGFATDFGPPVRDQLRDIPPLPIAPSDGVRDLRDLPWSSIDNAESRDLDQIEYAEPLGDGATRVLVGIADVASVVAPDTPIDGHAALNTTSLYAGVIVFPMLPAALSTDRTSLNAGEDRLVVVVELEVSAAGIVTARDVYRARVVNRAKLSYDALTAWLGDRGPLPAAARAADLGDQLELQDRVARALRERRHERGAVELETIEARPVVQDGRIIDLRLARKNAARELIEDFMIAANVALAKFLKAAGSPLIRRVVRTPRGWHRMVELAAGFGEQLPLSADVRALARFLRRRRAADPERFPDLSLAVAKLMGSGEYVLDAPDRAGDDDGHFALALDDYSHGTAPNRRYADLITQRLVLAVLAGRPAPYTVQRLEEIAAHCSRKEDDANRMERLLRKQAAAVLLAGRVGQSFEAIVTGVKRTATYARLLDPPAEGRIVKGEARLEVGDEVRVTLVATDPVRGYLDFAH